MKSKLQPTSAIVATLIAVGALAGKADAALVMTISEYTSTHITVTVSGTLDADTSGTLNRGTFFVAPGSDLTTPWYSGALTIVDDTMTVGGIDALGAVAENNGTNTGYSIYWGQAAPTGFGTPGNIALAGTPVSGTVRMTGTINNVLFSAPDFKLYSGQTGARVANRLEATAVPEPSSALLLGVGALGVMAYRRRIGQVARE